MGELQKSSGRIESLQMLRFLGAMCITVYHFTGIQGGCPFDFSHAVYLFYMISGFVVMLSTRGEKGRKFFITRRLIRILPLYWGLTLLTFAAGQFFPEIVGYKPTVSNLILSMLFIPFRRTTAKATTALRPIVGLGHTLQMEMLFYLLFFIATRINKKYRGVIAAALCGIVALTGVIFPTDFPPVHFFTANPYTWTSFIIGLAIYGAYVLLQRKADLFESKRWIAIMTAALAAALAAAAVATGISVWFDIFVFAFILCAGLLWHLCGKRTPGVFVKLGNMSFSYYLLHYYIVTLAARYLDINSFGVKNVILAILVSAAAWGASWVSWYVVENKLTGFLQGRLIKKCRPVSG